MKTHEYLVTLKNNETKELIDMFYIDATDKRNAQEIAYELAHEYDDVTYYAIYTIVEPA